MKINKCGLGSRFHKQIPDDMAADLRLAYVSRRNGDILLVSPQFIIIARLHCSVSFNQISSMSPRFAGSKICRRSLASLAL